MKSKKKALLIGAILLVALLLLQLGIAMLPSYVTLFDVTPEQQFSLSDQGREWLSNAEHVNAPVTIYVISYNGQLTQTMEVLLSQYQAASHHIEIKLLNPERDAEELSRFVGVELLPNMSMIVASEQRYQIISSTSLEIYYVTIGEESMALTAAEYQTLYAQYGAELEPYTTHYFLAEDALLRAIDYASAPTTPHMYVLTGHGEQPLERVITEYWARVQWQYELLDLTECTEVPDDASTLLIHAPSEDLSEADTEKILAYLERGGGLMLLTDTDNAGMPNLMRIAATFGLSASTDTVLLEGNANHFRDDPANLLPTIQKSGFTEEGITYKAQIQMPNAHAISGKAVTDVVTLPLFTTSDSTYTIDREGNMKEIGCAAVGVVAQNSKSMATIIWLSSSEILTDKILQPDESRPETLNDGNIYYTITLLSAQNPGYQYRITGNPLIITSGSMETSTFATLLVGTIMMILIPMIFLAIGVLEYERRRHRKA